MAQLVIPWPLIKLIMFGKCQNPAVYSENIYYRDTSCLIGRSWPYTSFLYNNITYNFQFKNDDWERIL